MKMMKFTSSMMICAGLLFLSSTTSAAVIFNGFGAGDSFVAGRVVSSANHSVSGTDSPPTAMDRDWAMEFTPNGNDLAFGSLDIALSLVDGENEIDIYLRSSVGGLPGVLLESWHLSNQLESTGKIFTLTSLLNPILENGEQYWVEMSAGTAGSTDVSRTGWHSSRTVGGLASNRADQFDEGAWSPKGSFGYAYRVNDITATSSVSVPAPTTIGLLALSLVGLIISRRRG